MFASKYWTISDSKLASSLPFLSQAFQSIRPRIGQSKSKQSVRTCEVDCADRQHVGVALGRLLARCALTLGAMPVAARVGEQ